MAVVAFAAHDLQRVDDEELGVGFAGDVFVQFVDKTVAQFKALGLDLEIVREFIRNRP